MSRRYDLMLRLKALLEEAFPGTEVAYWRDAKPQGRNELISFRDLGSTRERVNEQHEHAVRVQIDALVFGEDLGAAMNNRLDALVRAIGTQPTLGQRSVVVELEDDDMQAIGDGQEVGVATLAILVRYRTPLWQV